MSKKSIRPATGPQSSRQQAAADCINRALEKSDIAEICHAIGAATRLYDISDLALKSGLARPTIHRAFAVDPGAQAADRLAVEAWNKRMLGFQGPAQPSPALCDALNAGYRYLEVQCLGCDTNRRWPSTSCGVRRRRRFMNWNATSAAASAPKSGAIRTSAAIWSRCDRRRFRLAIRRHHGRRGNGGVRVLASIQRSENVK